MSFVELLPSVLALSRSDKLRLISCLAEDLGNDEDSASNKIESDIVTTTKVDRTWPDLIEAGQSVPVWLPNESYEAAAILWKMLEEEKSAS